jgi:hypothetical protein
MAIARACGWKISAETNRSPNDSRYSAVNDRFFGVPDYLNDLNAMHEAEKVLPQKLRTRYEMLLLEEYGTPCLLYAPAPVRAEKFLQATNLWKDAP